MEKRKSVFYEPFFTDVRMGKYEVLTYESGKYEKRYTRMAKYETLRRQSMKNDAKV